MCTYEREKKNKRERRHPPMVFRYAEIPSPPLSVSGHTCMHSWCVFQATGARIWTAVSYVGPAPVTVKL